ncbi:MAG TPA: DUF3052 domain-containing protein [Devosia sp.]|nr:DUF3052 domain-containing protein [Devosia sp.]
MGQTVGYSGTPLAQKLGLKDGQRVLFVNLPESLSDLSVSRQFGAMVQAGWDDFAETEPGYDVIHGFTAKRETLEQAAKPLLDSLDRDGAIWVSWPKQASKVPTDITEDVIRTVALPIGLVDVKVCAVDAIWSGLKLVIRKELR